MLLKLPEPIGYSPIICNALYFFQFRFLIRKTKAVFSLLRFKLIEFLQHFPRSQGAKMSKKTKTNKTADVEKLAADEVLADAIEIEKLPILRPRAVSGLYTRTLFFRPIPTPIGGGLEAAEGVEAFAGEAAGEGIDEREAISNLIPTIKLPREELRIDVDGRYPQSIVSGTIFNGLAERVHWIANVVKTGLNTWKGAIWYKKGDASAIPYTKITVVVTSSFFVGQRSAKVTYSGGGLANSTRTYKYFSQYFHKVEFEYDCATGVTPVTQIATCDHPNRPASLACENLSIERVFQRAGFDTRKSGKDNIIPIGGAGSNATWSDNEMHDAMQTYWSKWANKAQWSMWVFFAALHDMGTSLGGIMFDDIGPNHRQGTAIFNNSFISSAPAGDSNPAAWVKRMKFWTACHEMGHAFNLAHSWQKSLGTAWIPLSNEPEARSFMNYPYFVAGGQTAFFANFDNRFSNDELKFMRHAPSRFVQQGNADWFDNHGFQQAAVSPEPKFKLEIRANRKKPEFQFLEPVVLELKLTNISTEPKIIEESLLKVSDKLTLIIKKRGQTAKQWLPFAQYCYSPAKRVLNVGESVYESQFVAVGTGGWDLAEPGVYGLQVALHLEDEDVVSPPLTLRIAPPKGYDEEYFAQDFFSENVGRVLAFDGSQMLTDANDTLHEAVEKFADRRVAIHAQVALGNPLTKEYKLLSIPKTGELLQTVSEASGKIEIIKSKPDEAEKELANALFDNAAASAETLSHIDFKFYVDQLSKFVEKEGDSKSAAKYQGDLHDTLKKRGVLERVLEEIDDQKNAYVPSRTKTADK